MLALRPDDALAFEDERRRRLIGMAALPARCGLGAQLVLAADTFVITPVGRVADAARARAEGDEVRTVIAGYHWFTDWGRDTMICLEGLTLSTGDDRSGLDPAHLRPLHSRRPDAEPVPGRQKQGLYHTADATLWFFHALRRYVEHCRDTATLGADSADPGRHRGASPRGHPFRHQGRPARRAAEPGGRGYQLTWMDAKVDDWVVTPRRGKAVEINALWYNALCLLADWLRESTRTRKPTSSPLMHKTRDSFNSRFWHAAGGYLYDVVDGETGDDTAFRPNQLFAISLDHPVLEREHWEPVVAAVHAGCSRRWACAHSAGRARLQVAYFGDLRARDAAYHQGTVWAWLIGPFIDAWLKVHPETARRRGISSTASSPISAKPASDRSAKSSMPSRLSRRAAVSRRPGASPRFCAACKKPPPNRNESLASPLA